MVQLDVTGVDDIAGWGSQHDAQGIRYGVVDCPEAYAERTVGYVGLFINLDELRLLAVLLTLCSNKRDGEAGSNDGDIRTELKQPRDSTDVVLVRVGNDEGLDLVDLLLNRAEVRQDEVHAWLARGWEEHTTVDDDEVIAVLEDGHITADLRDTAQSVNAQGVLRLLRWLRQALGQIRALHRLGHVAAATVIAAAALTVLSVAVAVLAAVVIVSTVVIAIAVSTTATAAAATGTGATVVAATFVVVVGRILLARIILVALSGIILRGIARVSCWGLENWRSRLVGGGFVFRRWARLAGHLAGTVTGFIHS